MGFPLSARELASIGFPIGQPRGVMAMLKLYLDDTGTHDGSPVVGVGGLIGSEAAWEAFDVVWRKLLAEPLPGARKLNKWSSWDCQNGRNEFAGFNAADRDHMTYLFRNIILDSELIWLANTVDAIFWDQFRSQNPEDNLAGGEATAIYSLIRRLMPWAAAQSNGPKIAIFYDLGRSGRPEIQEFVALLSDEKTAIHDVAAFAYVRVADATPLQGADMVATESNWFSQAYLKEGKAAAMRAHFATFLKGAPQRGNIEILDRQSVYERKSKIIAGTPVWDWVWK